MNFFVVGTNHKYSPLRLREKLSFSRKKLKDALFLLKERDLLNGAVIISTCNRVELYADSNNLEKGIEEIKRFLSGFCEIKKEAFLPCIYIYKEKQALKHLFSVSCGLDSLIIGETQILGQIKSSFFEAQRINFTKGCLKNAFYSAIAVAKKVHADTKISEGKISVGSVTLDFIKERFSELSDKNILIIGVGKVTKLLLQYLKKERPRVVFISNRTFGKAKVLASQIGAETIRFDKLKQYIKMSDIIITATASPHFIIKKEVLEGIGNHNIFIVDLALPRDVEPEVKNMRNVELFYLEDLESIINENRKKRFQEAKKTKHIIETEAERLWNQMKTQNTKESTGLERETVLLP